MNESAANCIQSPPKQQSSCIMQAPPAGSRLAARCVDTAVDVPLLMSHPKSALIGVLQLLNGWQTVIEDDITVEQFSGAMTNMVYRCGLLRGGREVQVVLMRVHASSSDLFDRQTEIDTFKGVSTAGLGPRLLLLFRNGRVEEFLGEHVTLAASDIHDPAVSAAIAATLATFHSKISRVMAQEQGEPQAVQLWERLRLWLDLVQQVASASELQELGMADLDREIAQLEQQLSAQHPCWVAMCHNDLQYGNIMARVGAGSDTSTDGGGAAAAAPGGSVADAAPAAAGGGGSSSSSLTQQLKALGLNRGAAPAPAAAAAGGTGVSPRQQLLQPPPPSSTTASASSGSGVPPGFSPLTTTATAVKGSSHAAAGGVGGVGVGGGNSSLLEEEVDDGASLSNVSVAGSTAPSLSGLSAYSAGAPVAVPAAVTTPTSTPTASISNTHAAAVGTSSATTASEAAGRSMHASASQADSQSTTSSSLQVLGRSPHAATVQLPDGSLVLRGMRARPRGQSPEPSRGKRPETSGTSFSSSSIAAGSRQSSEQWSSREAVSGVGASSAAAASGAVAATTAARSAAGASSAGGHNSSGSRVGGVLLPQELQPPSAAAVLRHASSTEGEMLLQLMPDDPEAVADASLSRRRRISNSCHPAAESGGGDDRDRDSSSSSSSSSVTSDSSSDTTSAADSAEGDDLLLVPQHLRGGDGAAGRRAAAGLAAERAAAVSRSARKYRAVRKARLMPAEGVEFPTLVNSDAEGSYDDSSEGDSSGLSDADESTTTANNNQHSRGRSPPSRFNHSAAANVAAANAASAAPPAAAAAGAGGGGTVLLASPVAAAVTRASADGDADAASSCITFIDYEYSGFNPIAFDIANHWCEWAADYHSGAPHVLDFSRLPNAQEQLLFVEAYLRALLGKLGVVVPSTSATAQLTADAATESSPAASSPEPAGHSSLSGLKLAGQNPDSSRKSEAAWSTLSSRGGSVLSFPETDGGWETASQSSVVTNKSVGRTEPGEDGLAVTAAAGGVSRAQAALPLTDVWYWLECVVPELSRSSSRATPANTVGSSSGGSRQLSAASWQALVSSVVSAAQAYMSASHLQWALWAVLQAKASDVDFDFTGYGQQRWQMYLQTRPAAL